MENIFNTFKKNLNLETSTFNFSCKTKENIDTTDTIRTLNLTDGDIITATLV